MTGREFISRVTGGGQDAVAMVMDVLREADASYCVIDGLAVNAYAEPVVSLDMDIVVVASATDRVMESARRQGWRVESFPHSLNLSIPGVDLRVQIQIDPRYQPFLQRARLRDVLGYTLPVADLADVLQGKIWALQDPTRRLSKRQKDIADITRLVEAHPHLVEHLPSDLKQTFNQDQQNA